MELGHRTAFEGDVGVERNKIYLFTWMGLNSSTVRVHQELSSQNAHKDNIQVI